MAKGRTPSDSTHSQRPGHPPTGVATVPTTSPQPARSRGDGALASVPYDPEHTAVLVASDAGRGQGQVRIPFQSIRREDTDFRGGKREGRIYMRRILVYGTLSLVLIALIFIFMEDPGGYLLRLTGQRVFRMAPLHHHFELVGWSEPKVITRFVILGIICALFSLTTLKLR